VECGARRGQRWLAIVCASMMIEHGQAESLRSAREVLALTLEEARRGHPVELEGLVTVYGPRDDALSLQDLTGGIRVRGAAAASGETRFSLRQRVRVAGVTDTSFSPEIRAQSLQILGAGSRLQPMYPDAREMLNASLDCQWMRVWGVIRQAQAVENRIEGEVAVSKRHFPFVLMSTNAAPAAEDMVGRMVSMLGVGRARTNANNQFTGLSLIVPDVQTFVVSTASFYDRHGHTNTTSVLETLLARPLEIRNSKTASEAERTMARELMTHGLTLTPARLVGVVQYHMHTNKVFLEDETGAAAVFINTTNRFNPGDQVEVTGNPRAGKFIPELHQAKIRPLGRSPLAPPIDVLGSRHVTEDLEGRRVRLAGRVENHEKHIHGGRHYEAIILRADTGIVNVHLEAGADALGLFPLGSRVEVAGVCILDARPRQVSDGELSIFIQDHREIRIIEPAPLMKPESVQVFLKTALGFCLLAGAWIIALRHQVRHRTRALAAANRELHQEVEARLKAEGEARVALGQERELVRLKSNFVSMVSHEFRTPLGVIQTSSDLLDRYHDRLSAEKRMAQLQSVRRAVRRMDELMEQVLLLARFDHQNVRPRLALLSPVKLARRCVADVLSATEARCPIELESDPPEFEAGLDESLFCQALTNLLNNAVKYSPPGSPVSLALRTSGASFEVEVSDVGRGIPEGDQSRLFAGFYRGSNSDGIPGTGLGLVIVQRCVEGLGGSVSLRSRVGEGTVVQLRLPLRSGEVRQSVVTSPTPDFPGST